MKTTPLRTRAISRALKRPPMDAILRAAIVDRSDYRCDLCRARLSEEQWECHHRQTRSRLGGDSLANLIALHGTCHRWVHRHPKWSDAHGFLVPSHKESTLWRVHRWQSVWMHPGSEWTLADPHPDQLELCADA